MKGIWLATFVLVKVFGIQRKSLPTFEAFPGECISFGQCNRLVSGPYLVLKIGR